MQNKRLMQQLNFLKEIDKLKTIFRRTNLIADPTRFENTAEHSWHLAMFAMVLTEYANTAVDQLKVIKMVLLHDVVEIDAGDTFCYDEEGRQDKHERELRAAERIFALLPDDQAVEIRALWDEFEAGETDEAKFAVCLDRLHPLLHNYTNGGGSWKRHHILRVQVEERMRPVVKGSELIAQFVNDLLDDAVANEMLRVS